jgi:hypothetical protein
MGASAAGVSVPSCEGGAASGVAPAIEMNLTEVRPASHHFSKEPEAVQFPTSVPFLQEWGGRNGRKE